MPASPMRSFQVAIPSLKTDHETLNEAFRIAIGDLLGNVTPFQDGLLERPAPVIFAGLAYDKPWTRDASVNAWSGASLLMPEVSRDTLLSVLTRSNGKVQIGGQYWDCIIWTTGAWHHYLYTGDKQFLALALEATRNSLAFFEQTEFDAKDGLFRGPASTSDGVAAYPDEFATAGCPMDILAWPGLHPDKVSKPGYGIPMKTLSTNCLYYNAYVTAEKMAAELKAPVDPQWTAKATNLRRAINTRLWNQKQGCYRLLISPFGKCDRQEGLGSSYALLFGVADTEPGRIGVCQSARCARRHSLRMAESSPIRTSGWTVFWTSCRNGVASDSRLLGRGGRQGRQEGRVRP